MNCVELDGGLFRGSKLVCYYNLRGISMYNVRSFKMRIQSYRTYHQLAVL